MRNRLGLKGTKYGCGLGICGICCIQIDSAPVQACNISLAEAAGAKIITIEHLPPEHPVLAAWIAEQVPQCGYCQPGQIMAAVALLAHNPCPSDEAIDHAMSPVLCRCGTYPRIRRAIHRAAQQLSQGDQHECTR